MYGIRTRDLLLERQRTWPSSRTRHGAASRNRTCIPELEAPRPDPLDDSCVVEAVRVELTSLRLKGEVSSIELRFRKLVRSPGFEPRLGSLPLIKSQVHSLSATNALVEEEGIEPVWHRSSTDYRAYKAPPRPALSSKFGASPENRTQPHRLMRAEVPLERGMAREAGLEPAGSVLETDSVATSLTPSYFDHRISKSK